MKIQSGFLLTYMLLAIVAGVDCAPHAHAEMHEPLIFNSYIQSNGQENNTSVPSSIAAQNQAGNSSSASVAQQRTAVVLRFAVESQPLTDTAALSARACPQATAAAAAPGAATSQKSVVVDPKILDAITDELQKRLSKKMAVLVNPAPNSIPVGAMVISGCITKANAGNAAARLVGMNVGASHLGVHVVALSRTKDGWNPMDTFDLQVKGGDILPPLGPIGLAAHAARDTRQGLSTDAKKLADQILKKLTKNMKAREQAVKNS